MQTNPNRVFVVGIDGKPLMPTKRFGMVKRWLRNKQAKIINYKPFTIQLLFDTTKYTQELIVGIDPGKENIGISVINAKNSEVVFVANVTTKNKQVTKHMQDRKTHRQASRRGERLRRKRRAKRCHTTTDFPNGRMLHGYEKPVMLKDIVNTEAKFNNRKRKPQWLTPTANHLLRCHVNLVKLLAKWLPITKIALEYNKFCFQTMENGKIYGIDFQNGKLKGFNNVNNYIDNIQEGKCIVCGDKITQHHHLVPRSKGGSNTADNIIGLCNDCHSKIHTKKMQTELKKIGKKKKYTVSVLNQIMIQLIWFLSDMYEVKLCQGYQTKQYRIDNGLEKDHFIDSACIAAFCYSININSLVKPYQIVRFRRHDRAIVHHITERTYKYEGKVVAKNRKPRYEQKDLSVQEWFEENVKLYGKKKARQMMSKLKVLPSKYVKNSSYGKDKLMRGAVMLVKSKRLIFTGIKNEGRYWTMNDGKYYKPEDCRIIKHNNGFVFV